MISTVRCLLTYIVLPFVLPAVGITQGVTPAVSLVISCVAMFFITMSARRFWRARHPKRWHYTVLGGIVFVLLLGTSVVDIAQLVS
jgi:multisubunit Na+/H+ antiporter MnhB subunit